MWGRRVKLICGSILEPQGHFVIRAAILLTFVIAAAYLVGLIGSLTP